MTTILLYALAGVLTWTFMEYIIHRFLGHSKSKKARNPFTLEHRRHHSEFSYFAPAFKKAIAAALVLGFSTLLIGWPLGWLNGFAYALGLAGMYGFYEALHWRSHQYAPINFYGRWARKNHFYHHFKNPSQNHGVTSPIWDFVFGTHAAVKQVVVPSRNTPLPWLIDQQTGELNSRFSDDYRIAGKRK